MRSFLSSEALARASASHPWRTIGIWVVLIVAAMGLNATFLADSLTTEFYFLNNPDSQRADTPLEERLRGPRKAAEVIVVQHPDLTVENDDFENRVTSIWDEVTALEAEGTPEGAPESSSETYKVVADGFHYYLFEDPTLGSVDISS